MAPRGLKLFQTSWRPFSKFDLTCEVCVILNIIITPLSLRNWCVVTLIRCSRIHVSNKVLMFYTRLLYLE